MISAKRPRAAVDQALVAGARAHFDDPAYYTKTYAKRGEDIAYYEGLAREHQGAVLEYGIGNGRIAIPMARAGCDVWGIDWSAPMLEDLARNLAAEPSEAGKRVRATAGDMREARLHRRFPLVLCTFNTLLHLYTRQDVEQFLERVKGHLAPGGRFVFDVSIPQPADLDRDPDRTYSAPRFRHPTTGQMVKYAERFDYDPGRQILFVTMEFTPLDGGPGWVVPLAHRQYFPQELEALLHYNGFEVLELWGGFEREPLGRYSDHAVWVATLPGGRGR
jgi:SAM-dependent methyltransferase